MFTAADDKQVTVLVGLDLSAAFDTVNHDTLLQRLETEFGVTGTVLSWFQSYLSGRSLFVKLGNHQSPAVSVNVGVPLKDPYWDLSCLLSTAVQWVTS